MWLSHADKEIEELKRQAGDAEAKLTRRYETIENGPAELDDQNLEGRLAELKRIQEAIRAGVEGADARHSKGAEITPDALGRFACLAREGLRPEDGTFRRSHFQKVVQRAEVEQTKSLSELRLSGSSRRCDVWRKAWSGNWGDRSSQFRSEMAPRAGLEPATIRLTVECSTS
jgi:hypothetical protein